MSEPVVITPDLFLTIIVVIALAALIVCALIGAAALGHFFRVNARPVDDQAAMGGME